jgi:hypothetical protein
MIYTSSNVEFQTNAYAVDRMRKLECVIRIDTGKGEVVCAQIPFHVIDGEVATYTLNFRSIYAIHGGKPRPCLFHCYGEIE